MPNIKSLSSLVSEIWTTQYFGSYFETKGGITWSQNLISLSPLRGAPMCEAPWLWHKYILLYCCNKNLDGRMDRMTDNNYRAVAYFIGIYLEILAII